MKTLGKFQLFLLGSVIRTTPLELWEKVHPRTETTDVFDRLDRVRSRHDIEVYKVIGITKAATRITSD